MAHHEKKWTSMKGKLLKRNRIVDGKVDVEESDQTMQLPKSKPPYGIPISAKLGIKLIRDFHDRLDPAIRNAFINGKPLNVNDFLTTKAIKKVKAIQSANDNNLIDALDVMKIVKIFNELVEILKKSAAITIEKNILLKTLSQPECEGLRFYLCEKSQPNSAGENEIFVSLVTIGVDINGKDLLYNFDSKKLSKSTLEKADIEDLSLVGEYGHPPGGTSTSSQQLRTIYPSGQYVLLNYAVQDEKN